MGGRSGEDYQGSIWARFPAGPLERQFWRGSRGDLREEVHDGPSRRSETFLGRVFFGEASANYLLRCGIFEKVASE
jgi:hypothetical protein